MRLLRTLLPLLICVVAVDPLPAAAGGGHLSMLAAQQGLERWERQRDGDDSASAVALLLGSDGRANIVETNLNWAAALLEAGGRPDLAERVIAASLAHQDTAEDSRTRGLFRWFADEAEPFSVDATLYIAPALAHLARTASPDDLRRTLKERAALALQAMLAGDQPEGSFGTAMWAGAVATLGGAVDDPAGAVASARAVRKLLAQVKEDGLAGVHSPTFDALRIGGLRWAWQFAPDDASRAEAEAALSIYYTDMLQRYEPLTAMVVGSIGTAYTNEYVGDPGVAQWLLACDLPSAIASIARADALAMYFALAEYELPETLVALAEGDRPAAEIRTRTPGEGTIPEASSTCTWVGNGMSLGTMSGIVQSGSIPVMATCDLPERPTSYLYAIGAPATLQSAQTGSLALCSFNFDEVGVLPRLRVGVRGMFGRRDQIDRVIVGTHEWIGEPEAVGQNMVVAVRRGNTYFGVKILEVGTPGETAASIKPAKLRWFAEGNMDSLMLEVFGRQAAYPLQQPSFDVRVGLLVEVAPASELGSLEEFARRLSSRRVTQTITRDRVRTDDVEERTVPGRHEIRSRAEMRYANYLYHEMTLVSEELTLGLKEELLRNQLVSRTLPVELPPDYLLVSPALTLTTGAMQEGVAE